MLQLNENIGELFYRLIEPNQGCQLFCNTLSQCRDACELIHDYQIRIAAVTDEEGTANYFDNLHDRTWDVKYSDDIGLFLPQDIYHLSFSFPEFSLVKDDSNKELYTVEPSITTDRLMVFECSKGKQGRKVESHLLAFEAVLNATIASGFFGIVLPKKWIGRNMNFNRWVEENAASVCKIRLPSNAVAYKKDGVDLNAPGSWYLYVFQRPAFAPNLVSFGSSRFSRQIEFAKFRYTQFIYTLKDLTQSEIDKCALSFKTSRTSDWYKNSIRLWKKLLTTQSLNAWCGTDKTYALPLKKDTDKIWFLEPSKKNQPSEIIAKTKAEIESVENAIHIKPGPPVKLSTYNINSRFLLEDFLCSGGYTQDGKYKFLDEISRKSYSEVREELICSLLEHGLTPYITEADVKREKKRSRWLQVQLTPIERVIPVHGKEAVVSDGSAIDENGNGNGNNGDDNENWELAYDEIGMMETHPDLVRMWKERAMKMGLHKKSICYDYQFKDLTIQACKQSNLNGNVMGLGKTRESLLLPLLKCVNHTLIVVPSKLIGEWQDEIEDTVIPYSRMQRTDWQGKPLNVSYKIVEWAEDILGGELPRYTIIGYDKLKAIPRDGAFFRCSQCEKVIYSVKIKDSKHPCPDCNDSAVKKWRKACKEKGLRKYKVSIETGKKIHWSNPENLQCKVIDERPPRPPVIYAVKQKKMWKKMKKVQAGYKYNTDTGIREPIFKNIERKSNVCWSFADMLRHRFGMIITDEALYYKNSDSKRTNAVKHLCSKSKIPLTGTPLKGYPQNVLEILNWAFHRSVFPNYRSHDSGGSSRFLDKYSTIVEILKPNGLRTKKQLPKINNPELFQSEMAPLMLRHTRNEPDILACIPKKHVDSKAVNVDMDPCHREYYERWIEKFAEWWQLMKEEEEKKAAGRGSLLPKLGYLKNASTIPHFMLAKIAKSKDDVAKRWARLIGRYQENVNPKTNIRKVEVAREIALKAIEKGDKVIIFSGRTKNLDLGKAWCDRNDIGSVVVDGRSSLTIKKGSNRSPRKELVDKFRNYSDYKIMWAGLTALAEGMNIPEANWGIFLDFSWDYVDWKQALGRMIRPQQQKTVHARFVIHHETIDGYMAALCMLKERSAEEGIDYMQFSDFSCEMIPDIYMYANSIVDGTESTLKSKMWLAIDEVRKQAEDSGVI